MHSKFFLKLLRLFPRETINQVLNKMGVAQKSNRNTAGICGLTREAIVVFLLVFCSITVVSAFNPSVSFANDPSDDESSDSDEEGPDSKKTVDGKKPSANAEDGTIQHQPGGSDQSPLSAGADGNGPLDQGGGGSSQTSTQDSSAGGHDSDHGSDKKDKDKDKDDSGSGSGSDSDSDREVYGTPLKGSGDSSNDPSTTQTPPPAGTAGGTDGNDPLDQGGGGNNDPFTTQGPLTGGGDGSNDPSTTQTPPPAGTAGGTDGNGPLDQDKDQGGGPVKVEVQSSVDGGGGGSNDPLDQGGGGSNDPFTNQGPLTARGPFDSPGRHTPTPFDEGDSFSGGWTVVNKKGEDEDPWDSKEDPWRVREETDASGSTQGPHDREGDLIVFDDDHDGPVSSSTDPFGDPFGLGPFPGHSKGGDNSSEGKVFFSDDDFEEEEEEHRRRLRRELEEKKGQGRVQNEDEDGDAEDDEEGLGFERPLRGSDPDSDPDSDSDSGDGGSPRRKPYRTRATTLPPPGVIVNQEAQRGSVRATQQGMDSSTSNTSNSMSGIVSSASAGSMQEKTGGGSGGNSGGNKGCGPVSSKGSTGFMARASMKRLNPLLEKAASLQATDMPFSPAMPCRVYASAIGFQKDKPKKNDGFGGQVGAIVNPVSELRVGVSYTYIQGDMKEYEGISIDTAFGAMKSKTTTNVVSAIAAWNVNKPGLTAHVVGSRAWGSVKTTRSFTQDDKVIQGRGKPDTTLHGLGARLGYNINLFELFKFFDLEISSLEGMLLTPYGEVKTVQGSWKEFQEKGDLPSIIGRLDERMYEETAGLRHRWRITEMFELQSWLACVSTQKKTSSLSSKILGNVMNGSEYSVESKKQRTTEAEVGIFLSIYLTDNLSLGVNGSVRSENFRGLSSENVGLTVWFDF